MKEIFKSIIETSIISCTVIILAATICYFKTEPDRTQLKIVDACWRSKEDTSMCVIKVTDALNTLRKK